jgi:DNA-binding NarL/FixJ family response regulator
MTERIETHRPITVLIADDHPVVRAGLRALIATDDALTVVGDAANPADAVRAALELDPDVVLMDLRFGGTESGVDATRALRSATDPPAVLILTNYDSDADILAAVEAGANGYLLKDAPPDDLLAAIRAAAAGESALAPAVAGRLLDRLRAPATALTSREFDVLRHAAEGLSNAEIARALHASEATVKSHLAHVYTKLDVRSRGAAVAAARSTGILS